MGACILSATVPNFAPRLARETTRGTGGDCSCPRAASTKTTHWRRGPSPERMQKSDIFLANILQAAGPDCKTRGRGRRRWELYKKCVGHAILGSSGRLLVSLMIVSQLIEEHAPQTAWLLLSCQQHSLGRPFFTCAFVGGCLRPAAKSMCILKIIRSNYHNIIYTAVLYAL